MPFFKFITFIFMLYCYIKINFMDNQSEIIDIIKKFIFQYFQIEIIDEKSQIKLERLAGKSSFNYAVKIYDNKDQTKIIKTLFFKKYGNVEDCLNPEFENKIINYLSGKKLGPLLYIADKEYRIQQFMDEYDAVPFELKNDEFILKQIINILIEYCSFGNIYEYIINENNRQITINQITESSNIKNIQSIYELSIKKMLPKARETFEEFTKVFNEKFDASNQKNLEILSYYKKIEKYIKNYEKYFHSFFPQKGFLIFNHNDMELSNVLYNSTNKNMCIIDHEYAALNIIGFDIGNLFNKNCFIPSGDSTPDILKENLIDIDLFYSFYNKYLDIFVEKVGNKIKNYVNSIRNKEYYCKLHILSNLFWLLFCCIKLDYDNEFEIENKTKFLKYGNDRIRVIEIMEEKIEKGFY